MQLPIRRWSPSTPGVAPRHRSPLQCTFALLLIVLLALGALPQSAAAQTTPVIFPPPTFSVQRGFFANPFQLALSSTVAGAKIRYTLDGSVPTPTAGTLYSAPIAVSTTTAVRALAYASASNKSAMRTNTYIFLANVRAQSDTPLPGWPSTFAAPDDA
ncbi:MAG: chitobiase/beta-hexosaminidase C-terminal domain-containing protein, partial [Chloroflexales bacterium]|nr:chitobiase/beta-hexosaminidase C-terminal domain-containing protein [Chloroflexales bacterium]